MDAQTLRRLLALLLAPTLALAAAACGPASAATEAGGPPPEVQASLDSSTAGPLGTTLLAFTLDESSEAVSASFEGTVEVSGSSAERLSVAFDGSYDLAARSTHVVVDLSALDGIGGFDGPGSFGDEPVEIVAADQTLYVKGGPAELLGADQWIRFDQGNTGLVERLPLGGTHDGRGPVDLLEALEDADATIEDLGRDEVRGVETQHVRATVDLTTLDVPTDGSDQLATKLDEVGLRELPVDLWIGDDGLVRRFEVRAEPAEAGSPELQAEVEIFDYGTDPQIDVPAETETIDLGELFGD